MKPSFSALVSVCSVAFALAACSKDLPTIPEEGNRPVDGTSAQVAAPINDDMDNAVSVTGVPFTHSVNTTSATAAADDPDAGGFCDPAPEHTVWYRFTATQNGRINVNTIRSDYDPGLSVFTGTRGDLSPVACAGFYGSLTFEALAGQTYFILIGSPVGDPGGNLILNVRPGIEVGVTIDAVGSVNPSTGMVKISGTVTCSESAFFELGGAVQQRKSFASQGSLFTAGDCDGVTPWEGEVEAESGRFVPGKAQITAIALFTADASTEERHGQGTATARLKPSK